MMLVIQSHRKARDDVPLDFLGDAVNHVEQLGTEFLEEEEGGRR